MIAVFANNQFENHIYWQWALAKSTVIDVYMKILSALSRPTVCKLSVYKTKTTLKHFMQRNWWNLRTYLTVCVDVCTRDPHKWWQKVKKYPLKTGQFKTKLRIPIRISILQFSQAKSINKTIQKCCKTWLIAFQLSKQVNKKFTALHNKPRFHVAGRRGYCVLQLVIVIQDSLLPASKNTWSSLNQSCAGILKSKRRLFFIINDVLHNCIV